MARQETTMVVIDQAPLRRAVGTDCTAAMARLERARIGWHRFERQDKPAFVRWRAREFGALLSQAREVEDQIRDAQTLVHEVEMEMRRGFQDAHRAYRRVMFRRENPTLASEESTEAGEQGAPRKLSEFEQEALFQEWVRKSFGTNPDKMDDEVYSKTFEVFKSNMFRSVREELRPPGVNRPRAPARIEPGPEEEEVSRPIDVRVKEFYRRLVRRLHPDLRSDGSVEVSALWHEVQEAYAASDVARMEILLGLSDIQSNELAEETSLAQMHSVLAELNRSARALEKNLLEAQGEDAWNFARTGPDDDLRLRVERELKSNLAARAARLELFTRTIADWAQGPIVNRKVIAAKLRVDD
jgi:hypothetical protein